MSASRLPLLHFVRILLTIALALSYPSFGDDSVVIRPSTVTSRARKPTWRRGKVVAVHPPPPLPAGPNDALNGVVKLWRGDITELAVDAIQNAANSGLWSGGGIDGAIHKAAGPGLKTACWTCVSSNAPSCTAHHHCRLSLLFFVFSMFRLTPSLTLLASVSVFSFRFNFTPRLLPPRSFPFLPGSRADRCSPGDTKVTIGYRLHASHVLHSVGPRGIKPAVLESTYASALDGALAIGARSVALCCISTGIFGYPIEQATPVALSTVRRWLDLHPGEFLFIYRYILCEFC